MKRGDDKYLYNKLQKSAEPRPNLRGIQMRIVITSVFVLCLSTLTFSQGTETVLHSFSGYPTDGAYPEGGLLFDSAGNIYGTTNGGGSHCFEYGGCGTIYKISPAASGGWTETVLYDFCKIKTSSSCLDGAFPWAGLIMDAKGNLYGTTASGGTGGAGQLDSPSGVVFRLSPPSTQGGSWTETVLWNSSMSPQNINDPAYGRLIMDASGNIYGTAGGGAKGLGTVFELSPQIDGSYSLSILHSFSGSDGLGPYGVTLDKNGNLYGATSQGGRGKSICNYGCGLVYELSQSAGAWEETVLFEFDGVVGSYPLSPISIDKFSNLYGTFELGGGGNCPLSLGSCGGVFKLVSGSNSKYIFYFDDNGGPNDGNPQDGVTLGAGNVLYGTTGVAGGGQVYMLQNSHETILYNFCSLPSCTDGSVPSPGNVVIRNGSLYGATGVGGDYGGGVIYSITMAK